MGSNHILLVDDNESIHEDIETILSSGTTEKEKELKGLEADLFGGESAQATSLAVDEIIYEIDHAYQGEEAVEMVEEAAEEGNPYSLVFMDVRMPPGIDGIQAIKKIWKKYPHTEMVICTAYSDYSWNEIIRNLGNTDKLLFIKKPFDATAVKQMAMTLTTKWQLQQESISYTDKLETEVAERTRQLNELVEKYREMKDRAEKASATKSAFLANMSHEIRTPMNGVIGMNDLLLETDLDEEQHELSMMVKRSAESLLRVINDILDFSKIEAGKMEIERIPFNIKKVVSEVAEVLSFSSREKGLKIRYSIDNNIPSDLLGDPTRLKQVLLNYGSNAVKFTEEGHVSIDAEHLGSEDKEHLIRFSVTDTGVGIPENKQSEIFSSFSQGDSSTTRKYGGTGLGLAICRQLAELMDGKLGVESEVGAGSTFYFTVPFQAVESNDRCGSPDEPAEDAKPFPENLRILLAEDNKMNQMVATKMLEKEGFIVDVVENGSEAVRAVEKNQYAFVLMDIQMPEMDGYEATEIIRNMEKDKELHLPIIALTASAMEEDKKLCLKAGMDDFIPKPVDKKELTNVLKQAMRTQN